MEKLKDNLGILCITAAAVICLIIVWLMIKEPLEEYNSQMSARDKNTTKLTQFEKQKKAMEEKAAAEEQQLKSLRPFFEANASETTNSPAIYGSMFEDIIKIAQSNGLMIRSIETDMNPSYDNIFVSYSDKYFACEFKFFFVGSYSQLQSYLSDMNNNFKYIMSISKLNVTSFSENPDYLLIKISFTLYAKKTANEKQVGMFRNQAKQKSKSK